MMILDNNSECFTQRFSDAAWLVCSSLSCYFPSSNCLPLFILRVGFACILVFFFVLPSSTLFLLFVLLFSSGAEGVGWGVLPSSKVLSSFFFRLRFN